MLPAAAASRVCQGLHLDCWAACRGGEWAAARPQHPSLRPCAKTLDGHKKGGGGGRRIERATGLECTRVSPPPRAPGQGPRLSTPAKALGGPCLAWVGGGKAGAGRRRRARARRPPALPLGLSRRTEKKSETPPAGPLSFLTLHFFFHQGGGQGRRRGPTTSRARCSLQSLSHQFPEFPEFPEFP